MINLIINEYIKVFRKKGFIILIIIMAFFAALTNLLYKELGNVEHIYNNDDYIVEDYKEAKRVYESSAKNHLDIETYAAEKDRYDLYEYKNKFGENSWQRVYIETETQAAEYIETINRYELGLSKDEVEYNLAKENLNNLYEKLKSVDWKELVKEKRDNYQSKLNLINEALDKIPGEKVFKVPTEPTLNPYSVDNLSEILPTVDVNSLLNAKYYLEIDIECLNIQLDKNISYSDELMDDLNQYNTAKQTLLLFTNMDINDEKFSEEAREQYYTAREDAFKLEYSLNNGIPSSKASLSVILENFYSEFLLFIVIFVFMVAGPIVSQEFSKGTIKLLLIKPYSRIKILLSKYIVTLSSIFIAIIVMLLLELLFGGIFFGFSSLSNKVVVYSNISDSVSYMSIFKYFVLMSIARLPQFIILATLTFAMSTITNNTATSMITGFVAYVGTNILAVLLSGLDKVWVKFFVALNWDFTDYVFNCKPEISGINFEFSLFICIIHFIILIIPTFIVFKHKDIKNI